MIISYLFKGYETISVAKGDDNFLGTNAPVNVPELVKFYASIGMTAKILIKDLDTLSYCSGFFWRIAGGRKWGVNPIKVLCKLGLNLNGHPPKLHARLLKGTAISMLPIALHVPWIGPLLYSLIETSEVVPIMPREEFWKNSSYRLDPITPEAYDQAALMFDLSAEDVVITELALSILKISDLPVILKDDRFTHAFAVYAGVNDDELINTWYTSKERNTPVQRKVYDKVKFCAIILLLPLMEEIIKYYGGLWTVISFTIIEFMLGSRNSFIHLIFACFPFFMRVGLHCAWNLYVYKLQQCLASIVVLLFYANKKKNNMSKKKKSVKQKKNNRNSNPPSGVWDRL